MNSRVLLRSTKPRPAVQVRRSCHSLASSQRFPVKIKGAVARRNRVAHASETRSCLVTSISAEMLGKKPALQSPRSGPPRHVTYGTSRTRQLRAGPGVTFHDQCRRTRLAARPLMVILIASIVFSSIEKSMNDKVPVLIGSATGKF